MDYATAFSQINWLAVVVATVAGFLVGGVWYSKSFLGKTWMKLVGLKEKDVQGSDMVGLMVGTFVLTFVSNAFLALVMYSVGPTLLELFDGAVFGMLIGAFFVATAFAINYMYEKRPLELWAINAGHVVLNFIVAGAVIGALA